MKKKVSVIASIVLFALFLFFLIGVKFIDVGRNSIGSEVGLYSLNSLVDYKENKTLDKISDVLLVLGILGFLFVVGLGIFQLVQNKSLKKVHGAIYIYGGTVVLSAILYFVFEKIIVNYRPILVDGVKEASFPSTHVFMFVVFVLGAVYVTSQVFEIKYFKCIAYSISFVCILLMAIFRVAAGMHWISDVVAGLCLGGFIFSLNLVCSMLFLGKKQED